MIYFSDEWITIYSGHVLDVLHEMADESVNCIVTSPPYWGLRDYGLPAIVWQDGQLLCEEHDWQDKIKPRGKSGWHTFEHKYNSPGCHNTTIRSKLKKEAENCQGHGKFCSKCGAWRGQLGLEPTPELYVSHLMQIFREMRRVLRKDGTCWLNMGDSYAGSWGSMSYAGGDIAGRRFGGNGEIIGRPVTSRLSGKLKAKDLCGMPWRTALALQADGWYLRSDIIWCLSGCTVVYAWTQKGPAPMTIKDLARLDPRTVRLWNGERWTCLLGVSRSARAGTELEIVLRSGERIACTPTHRFPTDRGLLAAADIRAGDVIRRTILPEPADPRDCALDEDAAWFAGLYMAEGSRAGDTIQISGHAREMERLERLRRIAVKYGGSLAVTVKGNVQAVRMYGKVLAAILAELVSGKTAHDKGFAPVVWHYSNRFLAAMIDGYLSGDGHYDAENDRWRLGFCRNYNLERDLRAACARLGYRLVLKLSSVGYKGRSVPTFRGELRKAAPNGHHNEKPLGQVIKIRLARCRAVYDLGVEDEPHLFALASGVLTHNSKPNPMPESVKDRPTRAHEYIYLLTKSERYFYDAEAVAKPVKKSTIDRLQSPNVPLFDGNKHKGYGTRLYSGREYKFPDGWDINDGAHNVIEHSKRKREGKNLRMIFDRDPQHSPEKKNRRSNESPVVHGNKPGRDDGGRACNNDAQMKRNLRTVWEIAISPYKESHFATFPPALVELCIKAGCPEDGIVLDPFAGSGTTLKVAQDLGRKSIGIELSGDYLKLIMKRCAQKALL
jgi:DNA modification methylase